MSVTVIDVIEPPEPNLCDLLGTRKKNDIWQQLVDSYLSTCQKIWLTHFQFSVVLNCKRTAKRALNRFFFKIPMHLVSQSDFT